MTAWLLSAFPYVATAVVAFIAGAIFGNRDRSEGTESVHRKLLEAQADAARWRSAYGSAERELSEAKATIVNFKRGSDV